MTEQEILNLKNSPAYLRNMTVQSILEECLRLREALKFYGDIKSYQCHHHKPGCHEYSCVVGVMDDSGSEARIALGMEGK